MKKITIDTLIYRLIFNRKFRENFIKDSESISTSLKHDDIEKIDTNQLKVFSSKVCKDIIEGHYQNGLLYVFPQTFLHLQSELNINKYDIVYEFMESEEFYIYKSIPNETRGVTIEESFYSFLKQINFINDNHIKYYSTHEVTTILCKMLNKNKNFNFKIKSLKFNGLNSNYWSIVNYPLECKKIFNFNMNPKMICSQLKILYAATNRGFISGVINQNIENYLDIYLNEQIILDSKMELALTKIGLL
jgi:hypothetical protein